MSRKAKLKALAKPLLERNPDLVQLGDMIVMKPLDHILRTIYIGRTRSADMFHPVWAIYPLCFPTENHPYSLGDEIKLNRYGLWLLDHPGIAEDFADRVEKQALPRMRAIETLADLYKFKADLSEPRPSLIGSPLCKTYVDAATGRFGEASALIDRFRRNPAEWSRMTVTPEHFGVLTDVFQPALQRDDRKAVAALLRDWESFTVSHKGLEKYWQPSPFPFELEAG